MKLLFFFLSSLIMIFFIHISHAETIIIGTDSNYWYPYTFMKDNKPAGINIRTEYTTQDCIQTINRLQRGSLILPPRNAEMINKTLSPDNQLTIHAKPIKSKSYFMTFSIKTPKLSREEIEIIWNEIENIRNNESYMNQLASKYR